MEALADPLRVGAVTTAGSSHAIARDFATVLDHLILPRRAARPLVDMWLRNVASCVHIIATSSRAAPLVLRSPVGPPSGYPVETTIDNGPATGLQTIAER
jgi:hypothetical protein